MTLIADRQVRRVRSEVPVWAAPMAGGPSTWQLAAAVANAGGVGFLAGGMVSAQKLTEDMRAAREAAPGRLIGVNLFVPEPANTAIPAQDRSADSEARRRRAEQVGQFRSSLLPQAERAGVTLPEMAELDPDAMDDWDAKLDAAEAESWPLVTFTFGLPAPEVFERLHAAGCALGVTVTTPEEASAALEHGADLLTVQGPESGGHRSTHHPASTPPTTALLELIAQVRDVVGKDVPLVAAGGLMTAEDVRRVLEAGAVAAQCGTAFLRADEAGTNPVHRQALDACTAGTGFPTTALTRAFSGRWARGLENAFMREHPDAPAAYPEVNVLTGPLKKAATAAGDPEGTNLWAGVGVAQAQTGPAERILRTLTP